MSALLAFVAFLLTTLTGHAVPVAPAAVAHTVAPAPAAERPTSSHGRPSTGGAHAGVPTQRPAAAPTVAPGPALDPSHPDYAPQNPDEVIGRQIDCPDGSVGVVSDAAGDVACP